MLLKIVVVVAAQVVLDIIRNKRQRVHDQARSIPRCCIKHFTIHSRIREQLNNNNNNNNNHYYYYYYYYYY